MGKNKFKEGNGKLERKGKDLLLRSGKKAPCLVLSFKDFDQNQGQSFDDWQENKLLALAIDKLRQVCTLTVTEAVQKGIITNYTKVPFPPNSTFTHPKHIPEGITWSSMHIQGKECVIGYIEDNIFYVVFLDKNHEFWITKKKNT